MKRVVMMLSGFGFAAIYVVVMYAIYGDLNWGSETEKNLPWFETVFRIIVISGIVSVVVTDFIELLQRKMKQCCASMH